ncbi:MAG: carboxypeptidase-like regulatory domain-containing protein, partial [Rudaea sp.]
SALALAPDNSEIKTLRDRSALYVNGVQAVPTNPQTAVLNLQQLYQQDPNFFDIRNQLLNAFVLYGDDAYRQGAFCVAAREYAQAANLGAAMGDKLTQANASCKQAVLATATPLPTEQAAGPTPVTADLGAFVVHARPGAGDECQGMGSASGTVRDAAGSPLSGIGVRIYNDIDYRPPPFKTDGSGQYSIVLGKDAGLFHLVLLGEDGQPASGIYDLNYAGGLVPGCRWTIDWTQYP